MLLEKYRWYQSSLSHSFQPYPKTAWLLQVVANQETDPGLGSLFLSDGNGIHHNGEHMIVLSAERRHKRSILNYKEVWEKNDFWWNVRLIYDFYKINFHTRFPRSYKTTISDKMGAGAGDFSLAVPPSTLTRCESYQGNLMMSEHKMIPF